MRSLIGITNNDIFAVKFLLDKFAKNKSVSILGFEDKPNISADIILVPTLALLLKHVKIFNKTKARVYLFDAPIKCQNLSGIHLLDVEEVKLAYRYKFKLLTGKLIKRSLKIVGPKVIQSKDIKLVSTLLKDAERGVLSPILSFLYQSQNWNKRQKYAKEIYLWFTTDENVNVLRRKLKSIGGIKKHKALQKFMNAAKTNKFSDLRKAVHEIGLMQKKNKVIPYKKIVKKYNVDGYDLKFLISSLKKYVDYKEL